MVQLKPVQLHSMIGSSTGWTDELWEAVHSHLLDSTSMDEAQRIYDTIYPGSIKLAGLQKDYYLSEFHHWPPTVLLGAFDLMRSLRVLEERLTAEPQRQIGVESVARRSASGRRDSGVQPTRR